MVCGGRGRAKQNVTHLGKGVQNWGHSHWRDINGAAAVEIVGRRLKQSSTGLGRAAAEHWRTCGRHWVRPSAPPRRNENE